jgi:hypothetical protein
MAPYHQSTDGQGRKYFEGYEGYAIRENVSMKGWRRNWPWHQHQVYAMELGGGVIVVNLVWPQVLCFGSVLAWVHFVCESVVWPKILSRHSVDLRVQSGVYIAVSTILN